MSNTPPAGPIKPTALKQTPQTVPGPALPGSPVAKDKVKHHVMRNVRGTPASVTAKIKAHATLPEEDKAHLVAKIGKIKGDWLTINIHIFESDGRVTIQSHIQAQSES